MQRVAFLAAVTRSGKAEALPLLNTVTSQIIERSGRVGVGLTGEVLIIFISWPPVDCRMLDFAISQLNRRHACLEIVGFLVVRKLVNGVADLHFGGRYAEGCHHSAFWGINAMEI